MNNNNKGQNGRDIICRSHTSRSEKELYRICPTKLTKRELEDLYYALFDNNVNLKKTVNEQQDTIKVLSAKVQRMISARKSVYGKEQNDCCRAVQILVNEHIETITELKRENSRLTERVRILNMRLCSAKQFTKRSPLQARCTKCSVLQTSSYKNTTTSALNIKLSDTHIKSPAVSYQSIPKEVLSSRTVDTNEEKSEQSDHTTKPCNDNKCQSLKEEMEQKIIHLNEELSTTNKDYSTRINKLEAEVLSLRDENLRSRGLRASTEHDLETIRKKYEVVKCSLRSSEGNNNELSLQLSIEKRKVAELETQLKAAEMSSQVAKTIQEHLTSLNENREATLKETIDKLSSPRLVIEPVLLSPRLEVPSPYKLSECSEVTKKDDTRLSKSSDDSGYIDMNKSSDNFDDKAMNKLNQELIKKITELQLQLDRKQISSVKDNVSVGNEDIVSVSSSTPEKITSQIKLDSTEKTTTKSHNNTNLTNEKDKIEDKINKKETTHIPIPISSTKETSIKTKPDIKEKHEEVSKDHIENETEKKIPEIDIKKDGTKDKTTKDIPTNDTKLSPNVNKDNAINSESPKKTSEIRKRLSKDLGDEIKGHFDKEITEENKDSLVKIKNDDRKENVINESKNKSDVIKVNKNADTRSHNQPASNLQTPEDSPRTYTIHEGSDKNRTYSVDLTDNEISDLSDLPTEYDKSPRSILSPGEERVKCYTDSITTPTDYSSLSEGELPTVGTGRRFSEGEKKPFQDSIEESSPAKMEATLKAISDELSRCKRLLHYKKPEVLYHTTVS